MAQKMTLTAYLTQRGVKAKALTKGEAELLGIPYPLRAGWPRRHGAMEIEEPMLAQLVACAETARQASEEKASRSHAKIGQARPAGTSLQVRSSTPYELTAFPGFVVRQARRYRSRSPAPWAQKSPYATGIY
jgi:hypothetical protein